MTVTNSQLESHLNISAARTMINIVYGFHQTVIWTILQKLPGDKCRHTTQSHSAFVCVCVWGGYISLWVYKCPFLVETPGHFKPFCRIQTSAPVTDDIVYKSPSITQGSYTSSGKCPPCPVQSRPDRVWNMTWRHPGLSVNAFKGMEIQVLLSKYTETITKC